LASGAGASKRDVAIGGVWRKFGHFDHGVSLWYTPQGGEAERKKSGGSHAT